MTFRAIMVLPQNISEGAITMDYAYSTTTDVIRKSGKHLTLDERGQIQALHREGGLASRHSRAGWMRAHNDLL